MSLLLGTVCDFHCFKALFFSFPSIHLTHSLLREYIVLQENFQLDYAYESNLV